MKVLRLLLIWALSLPSGAAEALPTGMSFTLVSPRGRDPADAKDVGSIAFELDGESGDACRYWGLWDNKAGTASAECWVEEIKAHRAAGCAGNSRRGVDTMLRTSPEFPCAGFNRGFGASQDVFLMIALQRSTEPSFIGLIQWSAATTYLSPIEGTGVP